MKNRAQHHKILSQVTTVSEVAQCWQKSVWQVRYAILFDDIYAQKIGGTWVISLQSVIDFWGQPTNLEIGDLSTPILVEQIS